MIKTYALIDNGIVINLISWDGVCFYRTPYTLVEVVGGVSVEIGWIYQNSKFSAPE